MKAYKLLRKRKNGTLGSLFINRKAVLPVGEWLTAEEHRTKGYQFRPGWHTTKAPTAPHLSLRQRVWCEVEIADYMVLERPQIQGGIWYISQRMKILRELTPQIAVVGDIQIFNTVYGAPFESCACGEQRRGGEYCPHCGRPPESYYVQS